MRKRLVSITLVLCLLMSMALPVLALDPTAAENQSPRPAVTSPVANASNELNDRTDFYAKQQASRTCTLAAAAMMVRRRAFLDGLENWAELTERRLRRVAWSYVGLSHQFTIEGITVNYGNFDRTASVEEQIIALLEEHPEGIVVYNRRYPHAILVTDYTDGVFYCSDPAPGAPAGRYPVSQATITIHNAHSYWYIGLDINTPQGIGSSLTATDITYPTRLASGSDFTLTGQLTSPTSITEVRATIRTDSGTEVQTAVVQPEATSFDMTELAEQLDFSALTIGSYTMTITADDDYGGRITLRKALLVAGWQTVTATYSGSAPILSNINAVNLTETGFDVECTAIAPVDGTVSVICSAWVNGTQFAPGLVAERGEENDDFCTHVIANAGLLEFDSLLINITAMDSDGNTARGTLMVQIHADDENNEEVVVDQQLL